MKSGTCARNAIAVSILAVCAAGYAHFGVPGLSHAKAEMVAQATRSAPAVATAAPATTPANDFSGIVERFGLAVVNISIIGKTPKPDFDERPRRRRGSGSHRQADGSPRIQGAGTRCRPSD